MISPLAIILLGIFLAAVSVLTLRSKQRKYKIQVPRGPILRLPIVGHLLFLGSQPHKTLLKWREKYGPMFRIQLGSFQTIVINDGHLIRKAYNSSELSGRPRMDIFDAIGSDRKGLVLSDGPHVGELRQFFRDNFRVFATGPTEPIEQRILSEAENLISKMRALGESPLLIHGCFNIYVVNSLLDVIMGFKCPQGEKISEELPKKIQAVVEIRGLFELLGIFIPKLCKFAPVMTGLRRREIIIDDIKTFLRGIVEKHNETQVDGQPRDILDAYLEKERKDGGTLSIFSCEAGHLLPFLYDLFSGGIETTSTQMEWIMYYMVKHPEIQTKIQEEIDSFIGDGRRPSLQDRILLVFTEAVILESLRIASIFPLGIFHSALENCKFNGYDIPKDTLIIGNLYGAHHDPAVWVDPEVFRPDRFIDPATGRLRRCDYLVPFSWGKRRCIGEQLARHELFLFTVSILQQFRVTSAEKLPLDKAFGITVAPPPFKVTLNRRN